MTTKRKDYMGLILEIGAILCFTALILVVTLQVFARFALPQAPAWTEEVSRFLFIYSVAFAAPIAIKKNEYVRVDLIISKLNLKVRLILEIVIYFILTVFFALLIYYGMQYAQLGIGQTSPALGLSMFIPYVGIVILSFFITIYCIVKIVEMFITKKVHIEDLTEILKEDDGEL